MCLGSSSRYVRLGKWTPAEDGVVLLGEDGRLLDDPWGGGALSLISSVQLSAVKGDWKIRYLNLITFVGK